MPNYEYKYNKYVEKINELLILKGGKTKKQKKPRRIKTQNAVLEYERQNNDLFVDRDQYRKILRAPSRDFEDNKSVKVILGDPVYDSDDTHINPEMVYNRHGEEINEVVN